MRRALLCITCFGLVSCADVQPNRAVPNSAGADTCNASAHANLIGQDAVVALALPDPKRSYRLDEPVTTDYQAERLNIKLDETDTIIAIDCG